MVTGMTRLALVNAIYFKGNWLQRFNAQDTREMPFKINQVQFLFNTETFLCWIKIKVCLQNIVQLQWYIHTLDVLHHTYLTESHILPVHSFICTCIYLLSEWEPTSANDEPEEKVPLQLHLWAPLASAGVAIREGGAQHVDPSSWGNSGWLWPSSEGWLNVFVLIFLIIFGILYVQRLNSITLCVWQLESELTLDKLHEWTNRNNMDTQTDIIVYLPKFKLEVESSLAETLMGMGMTSVFLEGKADLTGMSSQGGLFISAVAHKAFVDVNEEGTEAAAATAGVADNCKLREEHFMADHPFLFYIRHNPTNSILFFGRFRGSS